MDPAASIWRENARVSRNCVYSSTAIFLQLHLRTSHGQSFYAGCAFTTSTSNGTVCHRGATFHHLFEEQKYPRRMGCCASYIGLRRQLCAIILNRLWNLTFIQIPMHIAKVNRRLMQFESRVRVAGNTIGCWSSISVVA